MTDDQLISELARLDAAEREAKQSEYAYANEDLFRRICWKHRHRLLALLRREKAGRELLERVETAYFVQDRLKLLADITEHLNAKETA